MCVCVCVCVCVHTVSIIHPIDLGPLRPRVVWGPLIGRAGHQLKIDDRLASVSHARADAVCAGVPAACGGVGVYVCVYVREKIEEKEGFRLIYDVCMCVYVSEKVMDLCIYVSCWCRCSLCRCPRRLWVCVCMSV